MASSSWEALGESFYRRQEIYSMQWSVNALSDYIIAGARWGGPLAMIRDDRKPVLLGKSDVSKRKISVYTSAGGLLQTIQWDSLSRIVALGWTLQESLVVLTQDGTYRLYPLCTAASPTSSPVYTQHSLGSEAQETGVLEARIYEDGMIVLLGNLSFVEVRAWETIGSDSVGELAGGMTGGKVISLAKHSLSGVPHCWCIIPAELTTSGGVEILISTGTTIIRLDEIEAIDQRISRGPFTSITASPNGRFLSLLSTPTNSSAPLLWVTSSDFTRSLSEFDLGGEDEVGAPSQNVWCGSNTVVVAWQKTVVMVGPFGETLKYYYSDPVHLIGEIDGTRIVSNESCEYLQKVPQSLQDIFRPGSASPAAILYDAAELFEKRSPKADEQIRNIRSDLIGAVDACIDAAGREFEVYWQKKLLKAASFGKTFLDLYNPSDFVQMTQTLRVLNAARYYEIGVPLTYDQYQAQSPSHLISRLTSRSHHLLSLRISAFLNLSTAPILKHWAQSRITNLPAIGVAGGREGGEDERELVQRVVEMLKNESEISCADIAETAWRNGRIHLATKLLDHEPRAAKQVPLLLSMKEDDTALVKSIESGDPNLVSTVLLSLHSTHSLGNFFRLIDNKPDAAALLQVYAKENDVELLRDFYYQDDRRVESGILALKESLAIEDFGDKVAKVRIAAKSFGEDKDCAFEAKMIDDQIRLLALQQTLDQEMGTAGTDRAYVGKSVSGTIKACIIAGSEKKAEKVRSEWKVPDKRWWYLKLSAHVITRDWAALLAFSKSKRSPIGYEPFVIALIAAGAPKEAKEYVSRCDSAKRVELFVRCGDWIAAGRECVRKGSRDELLELNSRCPNSILAAQLDQLVESMAS